ncbi:flavin-containing monooxygenase [Nocardia miyunensis]|uniref:flavin-containing monooxygenase n=1 Tax=Nocardia miyunensis TaxID=282684 RepID=UPI00082D77F6|nr:NAD(P)/FAD-dependent oxidoreductase [Nocardia miyunensis]
MTTETLPAPDADHAPTTDRYDAIVIGAGPAGLYELYLLRQKGLDVRVIEAGSGVGGTWYWNRYPGCRLHSESVTYQYFFSEEMLAHWDWSEVFAGQPELERYFDKVADIYDLRRDIEFETRVVSMTFDEDTDDWTLVTDTGKTFTAHVVVSATGMLSAPIYPDVPGRESFRGEAYHTARWPKDEVSFANKKVVVVGTGSSGVQIIPQIAATADHLTVLMRTPNWVIPLNNRAIEQDELTDLRTRWPELHEKLKNTTGGFLHDVDPTPTTSYSPEELLERYEKAWAGTGFTKWFGMPVDVLTDEKANRHFAEFIAEKVRRRLADPKIADLLIPQHLYGVKPVECESGNYYEVYNQDNVELVPVAQDPIQEITPTGIRTGSREIDADVIVFATGFEAFVGALNRIEITGVGGRTLRKNWADGPETYLGVQVAGFPNLFMIGGPHGKGGHGNSPRCAEGPLEWIADLTEKITTESIKRVEPDPRAQAEWTKHVYETGNASFVAKGKSYLFGDNVPGRKRAYVAYIGSLPEFVSRLRTVAANDYEGFVITR